MDDQGLDFIRDPEARAVVRDMLAAVVDHPDIHRNLFRYQRQTDGTWEYFVGQHRSGPAAFTQYIRLPINVVDLLVTRGWAEANRDPQFGAGWYSFTEKAVDWYRRNSGPSDDQVRTAIGRYFLRLEEREPNEPHRFDADAISQELGIDESRVTAQTHFLVNLGLLDDVGPKGTKMPKFYQLSRPDGFRWAATGFPPIGERIVATHEVARGAKAGPRTPEAGEGRGGNVQPSTSDERGSVIPPGTLTVMKLLVELERALKKLDRDIDHLSEVHPDTRQVVAHWANLDWSDFSEDDFLTLSEEMEVVHDDVHECLADRAEIKVYLSPGQLRLAELTKKIQELIGQIYAKEAPSLSCTTSLLRQQIFPARPGTR